MGAFCHGGQSAHTPVLRINIKLQAGASRVRIGHNPSRLSRCVILTTINLRSTKCRRHLVGIYTHKIITYFSTLLHTHINYRHGRRCPSFYLRILWVNIYIYIFTHLYRTHVGISTYLQSRAHVGPQRVVLVEALVHAAQQGLSSPHRLLQIAADLDPSLEERQQRFTMPRSATTRPARRDNTRKSH